VHHFSIDPSRRIEFSLTSFPMNSLTMRVAPAARALAFTRVAQLKRVPMIPPFGISAIRMMTADAPGPKVRKINFFLICYE
jgi:hypothetical protein